MKKKVVAKFAALAVCAAVTLLTGCTRRPADYFPENLAAQAQSVAMICPIDAARGDCDVYEVTEPAQVQAICAALAQVQLTGSTQYTAKTEPFHTESPQFRIAGVNGAAWMVTPTETGFSTDTFVYYDTDRDVALILDVVQQIGTLQMTIPADDVTRMVVVRAADGTETRSRIDDVQSAVELATSFAEVKYRPIEAESATQLRVFDAATSYQFYVKNRDGTESVRAVTIYDTRLLGDGESTDEVLVQTTDGRYFAVADDSAALLQSARDQAAALGRTE